MYNTIMFDLDDTLTNDYENTKQGFRTTIESIKDIYTDEKFERFYKVDKKTWKDRAAGKLITPHEDDIDKKAEWLRAYRFLQYFNNTINYKEAVKINNIYMEALKEKVVAREGALDIIKYLYNKDYKLIIATNGPIVPLKTKLEKLNIDKYISIIFSAEEVGAMKPHKDFYRGLLEKAKIDNKNEILFVGDELEKDIKGGTENNIDTCWYNPDKRKNTTKYIPKYEINKLEDLKQIL